MPALPVWRVTRTPTARRAFDALADLGVTVARLEQYRRSLSEPVPPAETPDGVSLEVSPAAETAFAARSDRPELADTEWIVEAVTDDGTVVGVQPVATGGSVRVAPLDRRVDLGGAYVWGIHVDPDWRRRGIATATAVRSFDVVADRTPHDCVRALIGADNVPSMRALAGVGFERERVRSYVRAFGYEHRRSRAVAPGGRR